MSAGTVDVSALHPEITQALRAAFGDQPVEELGFLTGGRSGATLLSLSVAGARYVVRRPDPARPSHERRLGREMTCLKLASERGVAPRVHHIDGATGVTVMDRIDVAPPLRGPDRIARVAGTLRRLHQGPAFPGSASPTFFVHRFDAMLRERGSEGLPGRLVRTMDELASLTRRFAESAPCHGDLNPGNVLETEDAVYLVDWEVAGASDPFIDLAQLGVFGFWQEEERAMLLEAYLERPPTEHDQARGKIARVMALGFFAAAFFLGGGSPGTGAAPLSIPEMLALLATSRERASAEVVAASLLEEMRRESEGDGFEAAKRLVAP